MLVPLKPHLNRQIPLHLSVACGDLTVTLQSINRQGERRTVQLLEKAESLTFSFDDVLPGKYKGKILFKMLVFKISFKKHILVHTHNFSLHNLACGTECT